MSAGLFIATLTVGLMQNKNITFLSICRKRRTQLKIDKLCRTELHSENFLVSSNLITFLTNQVHATCLSKDVALSLNIYLLLCLKNEFVLL